VPAAFIVSATALAALALAPASARAGECPARERWPTAEWTSSRAENAAAVADLESFAFTLAGKDEERKGTRTDGVVIVRGGEIVYERYARGYGETRRHLGWSVTKSFVNALAGIAVAKGQLALSDSVCKHVKAAREDNCAITVKQLIEFASGIDWKESYENESNQVSSVLAMLYGEGRRDIFAFVTGHERRDPAGESYAYSSGDTNVLAGVLDAALKPRHGEDYPWKLLFDPIGMRSAAWERDAKGTIIGSSYVYATPRDFARFGYLLLNDGCWNGARLLPEGWVADSTAPSEPFEKKALFRDPGDVQGRHFWLNRTVAGAQDTLPWPDAPGDAYAARGHWGQSITVVPSLDLVIVRVADDRESDPERFNGFLKRAIAVGKGP
jgi:CubicO group peptidase (beta-lactamase class C family)